MTVDNLYTSLTVNRLANHISVFLGRNNFPISRRTENNSRAPCPNFSESRFPESSEITVPVKIFCLFPNPGLHFGQIPYPENTLSDPDRI